MFKVQSTKMLETLNDIVCRWSSKQVAIRFFLEQGKLTLANRSTKIVRKIKKDITDITFAFH